MSIWSINELSDRLVDEKMKYGIKLISCSFNMKTPTKNFSNPSQNPNYISEIKLNYTEYYYI